MRYTLSLLVPLAFVLAACTDSNEEVSEDTALPNYPEDHVVQGAQEAPTDPSGMDQAGAEDVTPSAEQTGSTIPTTPAAPSD